MGNHNMYKEFDDTIELLQKHASKGLTAFITVSDQIPYFLFKYNLGVYLKGTVPKIDEVITTSRKSDKLVIRYCYENNIPVRVFDFYGGTPIYRQFNRLPRRMHKFIGVYSNETKIFNSLCKFYTHFTDIKLIHV